MVHTRGMMPEAVSAMVLSRWVVLWTVPTGKMMPKAAKETALTRRVMLKATLEMVFSRRMTQDAVQEMALTRRTILELMADRVHSEVRC